MPFCRECGKEVQADWVSCPHCSSVLSTPTIDGTPSSDWSTVTHLGQSIELVASDDWHYYWANDEWHQLNYDEQAASETEGRHQDQPVVRDYTEPMPARSSGPSSPPPSSRTMSSGPSSPPPSSRTMSSGPSSPPPETIIGKERLSLNPLGKYSDLHILVYMALLGLSIPSYYLIYFGWIFGPDVATMGVCGTIFFLGFAFSLEPNNRYVTLKSPIDGKKKYQCSECGWEPDMKGGFLRLFQNDPKSLISKHWEDVRDHTELSQAEYDYQQAMRTFKITCGVIIFMTLPAVGGILLGGFDVPLIGQIFATLLLLALPKGLLMDTVALLRTWRNL